MNVTYRSMDESRTTASLRCSTTTVWPPARKIASPECFLPSGFHLLYILTDRTRSQAELGGGVAGEHKEQGLQHGESLPSGRRNSTFTSLASMWFLLFLSCYLQGSSNLANHSLLHNDSWSFLSRAMCLFPNNVFLGQGLCSLCHLSGGLNILYYFSALSCHTTATVSYSHECNKM